MALQYIHVARQTDEYSWCESEEFINIHVGVKNMTMKHIDIFISDLFIKVNIPKIKFVIVWDLKHPIDFTNLK